MEEKSKDEQQAIISEDEEITKTENNNLVLMDGIKNLIANEINAIAFNALMALMTVYIYRISYLRHFQIEKTLDIHYRYFISIVFQVTMAGINLYATTFERKFGLKVVIIAGTIFRTISYLILCFSKYYFLDLFSFFVFGLSLAPSSLMGRNFMHFFFEIRGKLSGALSIVSALLSSGFNVIAEKIVVNPESDEADIDEKFYTYDVAKRVVDFNVIVIIINVIASILILITIVPYDKEKHGKGLSFGVGNNNNSMIGREEINKIKEKQENKTIEEKKNEKNESDNNKNSQKSKKLSFKKTFIKKAFKNKRILNLSIISLLSSPLNTFFSHQWRNIAIMNNIPTSYQQNVLTIAPYVNCFSQLVFGWISDSIPFRYIYASLSFLSTFISIIYCFTFHSPFLYSICVLVFNLSSHGRLAISAPHYIKVFGLKKYIEISTIVRLPTTILGVVNPFLMFFFDDALKDTDLENLFTRYFILYLILGILNGVSAILSLFETEDIFVMD